MTKHGSEVKTQLEIVSQKAKKYVSERSVLKTYFL